MYRRMGITEAGSIGLSTGVVVQGRAGRRRRWLKQRKYFQTNSTGLRPVGIFRHETAGSHDGLELSKGGICQSWQLIAVAGLKPELTGSSALCVKAVEDSHHHNWIDSVNAESEKDKCVSELNDWNSSMMGQTEDGRIGQ